MECKYGQARILIISEDNLAEVLQVEEIFSNATAGELV